MASGMYTHPTIRDVQVVGVPDEKYGEEVCACVILKDGANVTDEELIEFVRAGLSRYKSPRYIIRLTEFPMPPSRMATLLQIWRITAIS